MITAVSHFPVSKREAKLFDQWSLKQVLIHMAGWDNCIADNVQYLKKQQEPPFYGNVDGKNAASVEAGKHWSWEKAYDEFIKAGERVIHEYETLAPDLREVKFWKKRNSTPAKFLKIVTNHYSKDHLPEVQKWTS